MWAVLSRAAWLSGAHRVEARIPKPSGRRTLREIVTETFARQRVSFRMEALIKPRTRGKRLVRHRTRLDHETSEALYAYAHFLGESTEYVLNQVIDTVLAKDKDFVQV
jgi:hypothetical protein